MRRSTRGTRGNPGLYSTAFANCVYGDTDFHLDPAAVAEHFEAIERACAKVGRDPKTLQRAAGTMVVLAVPGRSAGNNPIASFVQDSMTREVRIGNPNELTAHVKEFEAPGTDLLTLTLIDPPGPRGIEQLAAVVEGLG